MGSKRREGKEEKEREGTGHGEPREIASWWRWSLDARRGGGQGRAGLVQEEEEERYGIGPVKKTREDWIGEEPEVGGDKRGVATAARRMGQDP